MKFRSRGGNDTAFILFFYAKCQAIARNIEWPLEDDETPIDEAAKDMIEGLLQQDPRDRFGVEEVKLHPFFLDIDFHTLLRQVRRARGSLVAYICTSSSASR